MHNDLVKAKYTAIAFSFCAFYSQATKFPFQGKICGCPGHKLCNMLHFGPELQPRNIHFHFFPSCEKPEFVQQIYEYYV